MGHEKRDIIGKEWECYYYCLKYEEHFPISDVAYRFCSGCEHSKILSEDDPDSLYCLYKGHRGHIPWPYEFFRKRREKNS